MDTYKKISKDVRVIHSLGRGSGGRISCYIRPKEAGFNRDRKVSAFSSKELKDKIIACITKYYTPITYYYCEGYIIGSNTDKNALKEYWPVCDRKDIGNKFEIKTVIK